MDFKFELVVLPVTDVDRSKEFYVDKMGWALDVDHDMGEHFRVVQMTPPGSACSVTIGRGMSDPSSAGRYKGMHLCVGDIVEARHWLVARGVDVGDLYHFGATGQTTGVHPDRARYGTFAEIADPDGNLWLLQEVNDNPTGMSQD
ncbi:MAG: VOC family protein [Actinobacteria bacterium]|nr:VOC family protein [Actinomycetota bacterium]